MSTCLQQFRPITPPIAIIVARDLESSGITHIMERIVDPLRFCKCRDGLRGLFNPFVHNFVVLWACPFDDLCVANIDLAVTCCTIREAHYVTAFLGRGCKPELGDGFQVDFDDCDVFLGHGFVKKWDSLDKRLIDGFYALGKRIKVSPGYGARGEDVTSGTQIDT